MVPAPPPPRLPVPAGEGGRGHRGGRSGTPARPAPELLCPSRNAALHVPQPPEADGDDEAACALLTPRTINSCGEVRGQPPWHSGWSVRVPLALLLSVLLFAAGMLVSTHIVQIENGGSHSRGSRQTSGDTRRTFVSTCLLDGKRVVAKDELERNLLSCQKDSGQEGACDGFDVELCSWTSSWSCPTEQPPGKDGVASEDGTLGFRCCCKEQLWKKLPEERGGVDCERGIKKMPEEHSELPQERRRAPASLRGDGGGGAEEAVDTWPPRSARHTVPVHTFYMYRACDDKDWPIENVNAANLAGVLWYLHNEVVCSVPRKFGISRVRRFKVQVASTRKLDERNMTFGVRFAYDRTICTGAGPWATPSECLAQYSKYGHFVGCNNLGHYPFPTAAKGFPVHYPGAVWYSLPKSGRCPLRPTGEDNCTWNYQDAGAIDIDTLVGIDSDALAAPDKGLREYDSTTDTGHGVSFWDHKYDDGACLRRLEKVRRIWDETYPDMEKDIDLPNPPCDFDCSFYPNPPEECLLKQPTGPAACNSAAACWEVIKAAG